MIVVFKLRAIVGRETAKMRLAVPAKKLPNPALISSNQLMHESISESLTLPSPWKLCRKDENATCVILNKVKNLMHSIRYTTQILRLTPQNDITTQSPSQGEG